MSLQKEKQKWRILTAGLSEQKMSESGPESYLLQMYFYCTYLNDHCKIQRGETINKITKKLCIEKKLYYTFMFNNYCCLE